MSAQDTNPRRTLKQTNYLSPDTYKLDLWKSLSTVGLAQIICKTILAPIDRWLTIRQTQNTFLLRPIKFTDFRNYLNRVSHEQGWNTFWRGNQANCWLTFWQIILHVSVVDSIKSSPFLKSTKQSTRSSLFLFSLNRIFEPAIGSAIMLAVLYPIDVARVRLHMNYFRIAQEGLYKGIPSALTLVKLDKQINGIYRGYLLANLTAILQLNIFLSVKHLAEGMSVGENSFVEKIVNKESLALLSCTLLLHPLDTLKKIIQLNNLDKPEIFPNVRSVYRAMRAKNVSVKLYNGIGVSLLYTALSIPLFATALTVIEPITRWQ